MHFVILSLLGAQKYLVVFLSVFFTYSISCCVNIWTLKRAFYNQSCSVLTSTSVEAQRGSALHRLVLPGKLLVSFRGSLRWCDWKGTPSHLQADPTQSQMKWFDFLKTI